MNTSLNFKKPLSPLQATALMAIFFTSMGVATVSPAMAKLAAQFPTHNYALISTLPTLFIVPTTLWAGSVAGKKVRYKTLSTVGILLFLIGGVTPFFLTESFTVLLVCRAVFGVGVGLRASLGNALVLQYYTGKKQADMLGYGNLISNLGGVLFQMAAGALAEHGWNYTFLAHLLGVLSLLLLIFQPEPDEVPVKAASAPLSGNSPLSAEPALQRRILEATAVVTILLFFQQLISYPVLMNMSLLFEYRGAGGATVAATALSLYNICGCLIGFLFGKLFHKLGRFTLVLGYFSAAAGACILCFARHAVIMIGGSMVMGIASALLTPSAYAILGMYVPTERSSVSIAVATGVSNLGGFVSVYYLNLLNHTMGESLFSPLYIIAAACCLLAAVFLFYDPLPRSRS